MTTLIVDGYNIIHAWATLKAALTRGPLEEARRQLLQRLSEYAAVTPGKVIVVFDGPRRANLPASPAELIDGVEVHFSGRSGSADHLIERLAYEATRAGGAEAVCVATSDHLQRDMVRAMGCQTIDARTLEGEVTATLDATAGDATRLRDQASSQRRLEHQLPKEVYDQLEAMRRGEAPPED